MLIVEHSTIWVIPKYISYNILAQLIKVFRGMLAFLEGYHLSTPGTYILELRLHRRLHQELIDYHSFCFCHLPCGELWYSMKEVTCQLFTLALGLSWYNPWECTETHYVYTHYQSHLIHAVSGDVFHILLATLWYFTTSWRKSIVRLLGPWTVLTYTIITFITNQSFYLYKLPCEEVWFYTKEISCQSHAAVPLESVDIFDRSRLLRTPSLARPGFGLMTSRSWQYVSCHWDVCSNHLTIREFLKKKCTATYIILETWGNFKCTGS